MTRMQSSTEASIWATGFFRISTYALKRLGRLLELVVEVGHETACEGEREMREDGEAQRRRRIWMEPESAEGTEGSHTSAVRD
jgi:hypothetical protein